MLEVGEEAGKDLVELVKKVDDHRDIERNIIARLRRTHRLHPLPQRSTGQFPMKLRVAKFTFESSAPCSSPFHEIAVLSAKALSEPILQTGLVNKLHRAFAVAGRD